MGTQFPPSKKGHNPQFSAHVCYGQMAGLIKKPLGAEAGRGPGDIVMIVLDGTQSVQRFPRYFIHKQKVTDSAKNRT